MLEVDMRRSGAGNEKPLMLAGRKGCSTNAVQYPDLAVPFFQPFVREADHHVASKIYEERAPENRLNGSTQIHYPLE